jgi:hypothetical protein
MTQVVNSPTASPKAATQHGLLCLGCCVLAAAYWILPCGYCPLPIVYWLFVRAAVPAVALPEPVLALARAALLALAPIAPVLALLSL